MRFTGLNILLLTIFLNSCSKNTVSTPVISEDKLINVLVDIHYAEAATQNVYGAIKDSLLTSYYDEIYQTHHITKEDFQQSIRIVRKDSRKVEKLYEKVLAQINLIETEVNNKKVERNREQPKKGK